MAYAAAPAAAPATPAAPATETIEEGRAPPTIDSHGGKLSPITSSYLEPTNSVLVMLAILSVLVPRRIKAFGGVEMDWLRLVPGLLLTAVVAWGFLPELQPYSSPFYDYYRQVEVWVTGALLAYTFLNLVADALFPLDRVSVHRSQMAMGLSLTGLLILLGLWSIDWYGPRSTPQISFDPTPALISLAGLPMGAVFLFLWKRFNGWIFDLAAAFGVIGLLVIGHWVLPWVDGVSNLHAALVAVTVAATLGFGLRGMGRRNWTHLTGRVFWAWAWILRAFVIAVSVSTATF